MPDLIDSIANNDYESTGTLSKKIPFPWNLDKFFPRNAFDELFGA